MKLNVFREVQFLPALKSFFKELNIPINYVADEPTTAQEILQDTYKDNDTFNLINDVYFVGMVDDASFRGEVSIDTDNIKSDYDGILIFGITLHQRPNHLLPTRSQLAEITRAFNREFYYTPVALVFKYNNGERQYIAFSSTERLKYKQEWREGEKAGKVSLLRDIDIQNPHRGHEDIINQLRIQTTGINAVDSFDKLYKYWQEVFNVSILNKKFYQELQSWYFWAIKEVTFPNAPNRFDFESDTKFDEAVKEHKGKNVIRLLTRLLFIWFIKEKKLVPEEIFNEKYVADKLIKDFTPQKPHGIFATGKHTSMYYRAILQNLFFATLNQEMDKREFRKPKIHMNVTNLMRYQSYFKTGGDDVFLDLMNIVPFMNGGLFECLDKPHPEIKGKLGGDIIIFEDGFSDRDDNVVEVPDFLFFDVDEEVDISDDIGSTNRIYKEAKTRGLLEILKSYKFTITENTPIEEDVALDPELLGKVFENLLASYNPETKTTARKQTGSFYTPREIVNYMVDESLIAYLKNTIKEWNGVNEGQLDKDLHTLVAFDNPQNPFEHDGKLQNQIIKALDNCKILDPACGSGAFPMGALQKMVHILHKVDPNNTEWKHRQLLRVDTAIQSLEEIDDAEFREKSIKELNLQRTDIEEAFKNNELDYGRKLYLIENCIYGVDIQSIATQISKLRFFISLVVDQKIDKDKPNYGVRPLPNLETKFVAANTLIGIEKPAMQGNLFDNAEVKQLEEKLKKIRHKLFSSKSPARKRELREEDKILREQIAELLKYNGWRNETARQLSSWDPYDQNASSPFFDSEWMFDISNDFNIIIGNPPYIGEKNNTQTFKPVKESSIGKKFYQRRMDYFYFFFHLGLNILENSGILTFITTNYFPTATAAFNLRKDLKNRASFICAVNFNELKVFESAQGQHNMISIITKNGKNDRTNIISYNEKGNVIGNLINILNGSDSNTTYSSVSPESLFDGNENFIRLTNDSKNNSLKEHVLEKISGGKKSLNDYFYISQGLVTGADKVANKHILKDLIPDTYLNKGIYVLNKEELEEMNLDETEMSIIKPFYKNSDIKHYITCNTPEQYVIYLTRDLNLNKYPKIKNHIFRYEKVIKSRSYNNGEIQAGLKMGKWWVLSKVKNAISYESEKIVIPQRANENIFGYNTVPWYASGDVYYLCPLNSQVNTKYFLGLLNSKLYYYWLFHKGKRKGDSLELYADPLSLIPIKIPDNQTNDVITKLVDSILITPEDLKLRLRIDLLLYKLYGLSYLECKEVDPDIESEISGSDYEKLNSLNHSEIF